MDAITVRPATATDAPRVVALLQAEGLETAYHPDEFVVATHRGEAIGAARLKTLPDGSHELASVAVDPAHRGHGVGAKLVRAALERATGPVVGLAVAPGFFERLGARRLDEVPAALREKAEGACASADFIPMAFDRPGDAGDAHAEVREAYGRIAVEATSCCTPADDSASCCGTGDAATGHYSPEELAALPPGAELGLGTGNPVRAARLQAGETVVDLGSGPGGDALLAARAVGPTGRVIGVDLTPEMVTRARENAEAVGAENVEFVEAPIEELPLPDATAHAVVSNCVINLVPDTAAALREAHRVLAPGGRFVVSDTLRLRGAAPEGPACGCASGALTKEEWTRGLEAAGFTDVHVAVEGEDFGPGVGRALVTARKPDAD